MSGLWATSASAQATRTWVSGVGDDVNPCSRTAPCKTFAGAISKTATAGEINCLDPGGFGGLTIVKSISIVCDYTEGGILSAGAGVNGFVVNAPATSVVFLSGLDFNGAGSAQNGLRIIAGERVHLQNSIIRNYRASNGLGISFQPSGTTRLTLLNVTISDNGTGATGGGVLIQPTGAAGSARVDFRNVTLTGNSNNAVFINTTGNTSPAGIIVQFDEVLAVGSTNGINMLTPIGAAGARLILNRSTIADNTTGIIANGGLANIRVGHSTITNNGTGISQVSGGVINTYGNNRLDANGSDGAFNLPIIQEE